MGHAFNINFCSLLHVHGHVNQKISTPAELEWMLAEKGAVKTELEEDPRKKHQIRDVMTAAVRGYVDAEDSDDDSD